MAQKERLRWVSMGLPEAKFDMDLAEKAADANNQQMIVAICDYLDEVSRKENAEK